MLLCGVYARSEAAYGNIDIARKIFDMALSSANELPMVRILLLNFWKWTLFCGRFDPTIKIAI